MLEAATLNEFVLDDDPSPDVMARVRSLRARMRSETSLRDFAGLTGKFDGLARHAVVLDRETPVAAARMTVHERPADGPDGAEFASVFSHDAPAPVAILSRLVVAPGYEGRGFAERLDANLIFHARRQGCHSILVATRDGPMRWRQLRAAGFRELHRARPATWGPYIGLPGPVIYRLQLD